MVKNNFNTTSCTEANTFECRFGVFICQKSRYRKAKATAHAKQPTYNLTFDYYLCGK